MKAIIAGAGVAGLTIAWRLAQRGCDVEVLERGIAGRGATWAAAGMIAPGAEMGEAGSSMGDLARAGLAGWAGFAAELEGASGQPIAYQETGSLLIARDTAQARRLQTAGRRGSTWLQPSELLERESLLAKDLCGALYFPDDAQVDNRALCVALCAALKRAGGRLSELCEVRCLVVNQDRVQGIVTSVGMFEADVVVLACGAWMNGIGGVAEHVLPAIRPIKGQMLACEPPRGSALPRALLWTDHVYLVPRHGRLLIGASVEDTGFELTLTREARDELYAAALRMVPALKDWRVVEAWSGLRPRTADDHPVLGATSLSNLYVASGQFRNGILFAPVLGEMVAGQILGDGAAIAPSFSPQRFGQYP